VGKATYDPLNSLIRDDARADVAAACVYLIFVVILTRKAPLIGHSIRMQAMGQRSVSPIGRVLS
jgi:hypothetical protein